MPKWFAAGGLLGRWWVERMRSLPLAVAAMVIGLLVSVQPGPHSALVSAGASTAIRAALAAWLLLALLRYADDVADRQRDKIRHPERVLPAASPLQTTLAGALLLVMVLAATVLLLGQMPLGAVALLAGAVLFYLLRARLAADPESLIWRHLLMVKYPALLMALQQELWWPALLAMLGGAALYELAHDRSCRQARGFMGWLAADTALVVAAGLWFLNS